MFVQLSLSLSLSLSVCGCITTLTFVACETKIGYLYKSTANQWKLYDMIFVCGCSCSPCGKSCSRSTPDQRHWRTTKSWASTVCSPTLHVHISRSRSRSWSPTLSSLKGLTDFKRLDRSFIDFFEFLFLEDDYIRARLKNALQNNNIQKLFA